MKKLVKKGATSQTWYLRIRNSSTGAPLTGLAYNTSSLSAYYVRDRGSATAITLVTQTTTGAYSSGGFVEVSSTNMPGIYRFDPPDAVCATGVEGAIVMLKGAANMEDVAVEVQLIDVDLTDAVRMGLTALPNVAQGNAGALITAGTGTAQLSVSSGRAQADVAAISTDTTAADNLEAMFDGTGYNASASAIGTASSVTAVANGGITSASFAADSITSSALATSAVNEIAAAILGGRVEDQPNYTLQEAISIILAFAAGRTTNGGATFKSPNNSEDRIVATVVSNERTAITLTPAGV